MCWDAGMNKPPAELEEVQYRVVGHHAYVEDSVPEDRRAKVERTLLDTRPTVTRIVWRARSDWPTPLTTPQGWLLGVLPGPGRPGMWCSGHHLRVAKALARKGLARCTSHRQEPVGPAVAAQYVRRP